MAVTYKKRVAVWERDQGICGFCRLPVLEDQPWEIDHEIPRINGGSDDLANLRVAHRRCNRIAGSLIGVARRMGPSYDPDHKRKTSMIHFELPPELLTKIDDYRFDHRMNARSDVIRILIKQGLDLFGNAPLAAREPRA